MESVILELTSTATIAITVFGIAYCLIQSDYSRVRRCFAAFLGAITVNNMPDAFTRLNAALPERLLGAVELTIWSPSSLLLAPLFWIYVYVLTSPSQQLPAHLLRHLCLPILAVLVGLATVAFAPEAVTTLYADAPPPSSAAAMAAVFALVLLFLAIYPQMAIYLFLIIRRLMRYRLLLRDVYASTEEHELRWIYVIGALGALFWVANAILLLLAFGPDHADTPAASLNIASLAGLALVATTTLWGLRQRPPLVPDVEATDPPATDPHPPSGPSGDKYEKSALSAEAASRISRKLRAAMETDHLHRDPNLSLWVLARHIGASPNYVSQTLNEVIGESFFDFVNGYRITEAKKLLSTTNDTVLAITYDVGFNARSSFYNAFKRITGQTPNMYRKTMYQKAVSCPVGMDDRTN